MGISEIGDDGPSQRLRIASPHVLPDCSSMPIVVADNCALCVAGITKEYQEWVMEREESSAES